MTNNNFNRFDDIENTTLQVFNRTVLLSNLYQDGGEATARQYAEKFSDQERLSMVQMQSIIAMKGLEEVKREIIKSLDITEDFSNV